MRLAVQKFNQESWETVCQVVKRKKSKYNKQYIETWKCKGCEFEWCYKTMKCPLCYSLTMIKII